VDLDEVLLDQPLVGEEVHNVLALVALVGVCGVWVGQGLAWMGVTQRCTQRCKRWLRAVLKRRGWSCCRPKAPRVRLKTQAARTAEPQTGATYLQLDHLAELGVIYHGAVAAELCGSRCGGAVGGSRWVRALHAEPPMQAAPKHAQPHADSKPESPRSPFLSALSTFL